LARGVLDVENEAMCELYVAIGAFMKIDGLGGERRW
jgi:hypothetical protein